MDTNENKEVASGRKASAYRGVSFHRERRVWYGRITKDGKTYQLGAFTNEIACANAYNYYARKLYGKNTDLNDVPYMKKREWDMYKRKRGEDPCLKDL